MGQPGCAAAASSSSTLLHPSHRKLYEGIVTGGAAAAPARAAQTGVSSAFGGGVAFSKARPAEGGQVQGSLIQPAWGL